MGNPTSGMMLRTAIGWAGREQDERGDARAGGGDGICLACLGQTLIVRRW